MDDHKNYSYSTVATAPSPATSGTSLVVATGDGAKFPSTPFNATIWPTGSTPLSTNSEIVRVTAIATDTLTIVRAQEGSSARTVVVGDQIAATITAKVLTDIENPILDGWIDDSAETWTYASGSGGGTATFTVSGDKRTKYTVGTRIKLTQTTVKYFVVSADSTFAGGNTTVTITGGSDYTLANAAISANYHSYAANPQGYPTWFSTTVTWTGFSANPTYDARFAVTGRICNYTLTCSANGTSNSTTLTVSLPIPFNGSRFQNWPCSARDNGIDQGSPGWLSIQNTVPTSTMNAFRDFSGLGWSTSGGKIIQFVIAYQI